MSNTPHVKSTKSDNQSGLSAYHVVSPLGLLNVTGTDRIDFLQRQTTNDLHALSAERPLVTVLTSPTARILDVLTVYVSDENTLGVLTLPSRATQTSDFLRKRIFFQDNVTVVDVSEEFQLVELFMVSGLQAVDQPNYIAQLLSEYHESARFIQVEQGKHAAMYLLAETSSIEGICETLDASGLSSLTARDSESLRIENGIPGPNELTEDYTPLETNLRYAVADAKGCYTGQEIIARQITYDKVTRHLVGLHLDHLAQLGDVVVVDGRKVGTLTSVSDSPRFGPIGLSVVNKKQAPPGTTVEIQGHEQSIRASITDLPFAD